MNKPTSNNEKSLIPLIIFLSIIVFLTVWIINIDVNKHDKDEEESHLFEYKKSWNVANSQQNNKTALHTTGKKFHFNSALKIAEARRFLENKHLDKAEDILKTVLVFEPDNTTVLSMLGGIYYYSGKYSEAEQIFKRESTILPESARIYNSLASAQARQQKYSEAISSGQRALSLDPDIPQIHINLAGMYSISGNTRKALEHFKKAYSKLGNSILPLMSDPAFKNLRNSNEYQLITAKLKINLPAHSLNAEQKH